MDYIHTAENRGHWPALVCRMMNCSFHEKLVIFLRTRVITNVNFYRKTVLLCWLPVGSLCSRHNLLCDIYEGVDSCDSKRRLVMATS